MASTTSDAPAGAGTTTGLGLSPALEDYLEAVLFAVRNNRVARVRDIATQLGVGSPAVTAALKALAKRGLVNYEAYQLITLTDAGREQAERISQRHHALRRFLTDVLGIDEARAEANACRLEHAMDDEVLERLERFHAFVRQCGRAGDDWIEGFASGRCGEGRNQDCDSCVASLAAGREAKHG